MQLNPFLYDFSLITICSCSKLFRSYDNRLRPTDRRPDVYLDANIKINDVDGPIAQIFLRIFDKNVRFDSPRSPNEDDARDRMDWLWAYYGNLLIISTPYHDGVHYATRPFHFTPIIDHLEQLHVQGCVHGDIRAYNMVLKYNTAISDQSAVGSSDERSAEGWLIDFDYGGKHVDNVCYPNGYKDMLYDGDRPGKEKKRITIMDDWKSLIGLILRKYSLVEKIRTGQIMIEPTREQEGEMFGKIRKLDKYIEKKPEDSDPRLSDFVEPVKLLRDYINFASELYDITPKENFQSDLEKCGFLTSLNASQAATGSPPKKKLL